MTVDRSEASAMLADVAGIERRTRELLLYARAGDYLLLWGALFVTGYIADDLVPGRFLNGFWWMLQALGLAGTVLITLRAHRRGSSSAVLWRVAATVLAITAFGTMWTRLAHFGVREEIAFWPTFLSLQLFMFGLWAGRVLVMTSLALCVLAMAGYFWAGHWFHLWMAVAVGGAMVLSGFWLRR